MKDFIGQEIAEGCYVAYPGAGNKKAEYGMILYKVDQIVGDKLKARRITIFYQSATIEVTDGSITDQKIYTSPHRDPYRIWIKVQKSTLSSPLKTVVVDKVPIAAQLILEGHPQAFDIHSAEEFAGWVHGSGHIPYSKFIYG